MRIVTLNVATRESVSRRFVRALAGEKQGAFISFASPELLWRVLTARRWAILRAMAGAGPLTLREVARRVARDVKAVHGDVHALLAAGLVEKTAEGKIVFPWEAVRVDFTLAAA